MQERLVVVGQLLVAGPEPTEVVKPREGSLDDPSLSTHPGAVGRLSPSDRGLHAAGPELAPVLVEVIAAVSQQPVRALPRPPALAFDRFKTVNQWQQLGDVVAIPPSQSDRQGNTAGVGQQMVL